jgi:hypothetical protein
MQTVTLPIDREYYDHIEPRELNIDSKTIFHPYLDVSLEIGNYSQNVLSSFSFEAGWQPYVGYRNIADRVRDYPMALSYHELTEAQRSFHRGMRYLKAGVYLKPGNRNFFVRFNKDITHYGETEKDEERDKELHKKYSFFSGPGYPRAAVFLDFRHFDISWKGLTASMPWGGTWNTPFLDELSVMSNERLREDSWDVISAGLKIQYSYGSMELMFSIPQDDVVKQWFEYSVGVRLSTLGL